jgi:MFS transporter, DHA1 family, multidrug resistance protein
MLDIHRDSPIGAIMRFISRGRLAKWHDKDSQSGFPNGALGTGTSEKSKSMPTDMKLVAWYGDDDPDNPLNWSLTKKLWVSLVLFFYSFAGYIGSSLYAASAPDISQLFKTSDVVTGLGFAIYILGYGIGPLLFSPLSEIPAVGRNWTYLISFSLFVILCVPMSLVENFAGILVLRFLLGFFCSPCLATVGASYSDMFGPIELPYVIAIWGGGTTLAPVCYTSSRRN